MCLSKYFLYNIVITFFLFLYNSVYYVIFSRINVENCWNSDLRRSISSILFYICVCFIFVN